MLHFGLIGLSLKHSFSEKFFKQKFESENILASYVNYELQNLESLPTLIAEKQLSGFNVTVPFKEKILPYLDIIDKSANEIGAVNCVKISQEKKIGFNTDFIGFEKSFLNCIAHMNDSKALVCGTGGSSKAVQYCLNKNRIPFQLISRIETENTISYLQIDKKMMEENKIIINTTPIGMFPNVDEVLPLPYQYITPQHVAYDLIYNPENSTFLQRCMQKGAILKNGLEMLHIQAEESFKIFFSKNKIPF